MSSSASISAAKKRRANQVQPPTAPQPTMQRPGTAPAPSLANMSPAQRQQFMIQQQRMMQQQQMQQQQQQQKPQSKQLSGNQSGNQTGNQKTASSSKAPALTWPMPPIYLMKQMDTILFQQSQSIDELKNRLNCIESGSLPDGLPNAGSGSGSGSGGSQLVLEQTKHSLLVDDEFVSGIVDNIMTNSNLSEIVEQIDIVQNENRELRELLHAQQKTINEMNVMLLKLISQSLNQPQAAVSLPLSQVSGSTQPPADAEEEEEEEDAGEEEAEEETLENNIQLDVIDSGTKA